MEYIYALKNGQFVKLGCSKHPKQRRYQLANEMQKLPDPDSPVNLIAAWAGDIEAEKAVHETWAHLQYRGEWFTLSQELQVFLDKHPLPIELQPKPTKETLLTKVEVRKAPPPPPKAKLRPNGEVYSSDSSERAIQLREDGKIGGQYGALGGRPSKAELQRKAEQAAQERIKEALNDFSDDQLRDLVTVVQEAQKPPSFIDWLEVGDWAAP